MRIYTLISALLVLHSPLMASQLPMIYGHHTEGGSDPDILPETLQSPRSVFLSLEYHSHPHYHHYACFCCCYSVATANATEQ